MRCPCGSQRLLSKAPLHEVRGRQPHETAGSGASPDGAATFDGDYLILVRSTPIDNRMHATDARDMLGFALAFGVLVEPR